MADPTDKVTENAAGKFYVDATCIDCDACRTIAPLCFARNDDGGYSFVCRQPENDEEAHKCEEALEGCPVEAIGNDGVEA